MAFRSVDFTQARIRNLGPRHNSDPSVHALRLTAVEIALRCKGVWTITAEIHRCEVIWAMCALCSREEWRQTSRVYCGGIISAGLERVEHIWRGKYVFDKDMIFLTRKRRFKQGKHVLMRKKSFAVWTVSTRTTKCLVASGNTWANFASFYRMVLELIVHHSMTMPESSYAIS